MAPNGHKIGYARVSTTDQDTGIQVQQLLDAGCDKVFHEQLSGTKGIAKAKAAGKYKGRPPVSDRYLDDAQKMINLGIPKAKVARDLGIGRATLYRLLAKAS